MPHRGHLRFLGDGSGEKTKGSERKLTGSYYTPPTLVGELVKTTLDPVVAQAIASRPEDPRAAILALRVVDPSCGSGHFLLAAARRLAAEIARLESRAATADEASRQHALREVVQHCIFGVDRNPLSVELCKTALWMETVEPGKPLTFLDSHILLGDSLVGILDPEIMDNGIPADAYKPLTGDDKAVCRDLKKRNRQPGLQSLFDQDAVLEVAVASLDLDDMPEDTLEDVERKRTTWEMGQRDEARSRETLRADLFMGAWFAPKTLENLEKVPHTQDLNRLADNRPLRRGAEDFLQYLAETHHSLHWHLAFAEIMQDGGFDAVLGNPPWEVSQLNEEEFFATKAPSIANLAGEARKIAIARLQEDDPQLWSEYQLTCHDYEAKNNFCRKSGRFSLCAFGKLNSYALFAETFLQLLNPRGRAGLIVPTGIATDHSTKAFFRPYRQPGAACQPFRFREQGSGVLRCSPFIQVLSPHARWQGCSSSRGRVRVLSASDRAVEGDRAAVHAVRRRFLVVQPQYTNVPDIPHPAGHGNRTQDVPSRWRVMEGSETGGDRGEPVGHNLHANVQHDQRLWTLQDPGGVRGRRLGTPSQRIHAR